MQKKKQNSSPTLPHKMGPIQVINGVIAPTKMADKSFSIDLPNPNPPPLSIGKSFFRVLVTICHILWCWIHLVYCHPVVPSHFNCLRQIPTSYGLGGWETNYRQVQWWCWALEPKVATSHHHPSFKLHSCQVKVLSLRQEFQY